MKDTWLNHNTDKMILFILVLLSAGVVLFILFKAPNNGQLTSWATGAFSTFTGALILVLTGRRERADNQTANGISTPPGGTNASSKTVVTNVP